MARLIKAELKKTLFKKSIMIVWIISLLLGILLIHNGRVNEVYADAFYKSYGYTPIMGLIIFMILSGSYTTEYDSNMKDLINSTRNGKKNLVMAKAIGGAMAAAIVNITIIMAIFLDGIRKGGVEGLQLPLKDLWYFRATNSSLNVIQMMIIVIISAAIASFFFAQLALYLSSISKSATMPFIVGGLIMGLPYILEGFMPAKTMVLTPLWGMISSQIVKYNGGIKVFLIQGIVFIAGCLIFPKLAYTAFTKESRR